MNLSLKVIGKKCKLTQLNVFTVVQCRTTVCHATSNPSDEYVDFNTEVEYTCAEGYTHASGDMTQKCQADGTLDGTGPVCTSESILIIL